LEEDDVRATSAFNRMLGLAGAWVRDVCFGGDGVVVVVVRRGRRAACAGCGCDGRGVVIHEHKLKRWRHLDLGGGRSVIECDVRRLRCAHCGYDGVERVEWARAASSYTRDFEDLCAWLAQQMSKKQVKALLRIGWASVGRIIERVVADYVEEDRLDGLVWLGVDEISYQADHRFLTCVADHHTGAIVWAAPGRNSATLQAFFDQLTPEQKSSIRAVSIDMSAGYEKAINDSFSDSQDPPQVAFDPFHVIALGGRAVDQVRRAEWNAHGRSGSEKGTWIKGLRYSLIKRPENQTVRQLAKLHAVQQTKQADVLRVPVAARAARRLPRPARAGPRATRRLACVGVAVAPETVRQARPHDPKAQGRRARRDRAGTQQRTAGGPELQDPPAVAPRLRISLIRRPDRHDLSLLRRHRHRPSPPMNQKPSPQTETRTAKTRSRHESWASIRRPGFSMEADYGTS